LKAFGFGVAKTGVAKEVVAEIIGFAKESLLILCQLRYAIVLLSLEEVGYVRLCQG
jgi:hypothetical protein